MEALDGDEELYSDIDFSPQKYVDAVIAIDLNSSMFITDEPDECWNCIKVALEYTYKICIDSVFKGNNLNNVGLLFFGSIISQQEEPIPILEYKKYGPISKEFLKQLDNLRQEPLKLYLFTCNEESSKSGYTSISTIREVYQFVCNIYEQCESLSENNSKKFFFLMTNNDLPLIKNMADSVMVKSIFESLEKNRIKTLVIPLEPNFSYEKFYKNCSTYWGEFENVNLWNRYLFSLALGRRKFSHTFIYITPHMKSFNRDNFPKNSLKISVSIYMACSSSKLNANIFSLANKFSGKIVTVKTEELCNTHNIIVEPHNIGKYFKVLDKDLDITEKDMAEIYNMNNLAKGFHVLGFCNLDTISLSYTYKKTYFLYPNNKIDKNSAKLYWSLMECCVKLKKAIICQYIGTVSDAIYNVALIPHASNLSVDQEYGFYVIFLPYVDDMRLLEKLPNAPSEVMETSLKNTTDSLIDSMMFDFNYHNFFNKDLICQKNLLERLALDDVGNNLKKTEPLNVSTFSPIDKDQQPKIRTSINNFIKKFSLSKRKV